MDKNTLKKLQSVLYNVQQVMAGYSQDDTWSDYDREAHAELIKMQYIVEELLKPTEHINSIDPKPNENDYTYGARDASGEVYDMVDSSFKTDLAAWKKRQQPNSIEEAAEAILDKYEPNAEYSLYYYISNVLEAMEELATSPAAGEYWRERFGKENPIIDIVSCQHFNQTNKP